MKQRIEKGNVVGKVNSHQTYSASQKAVVNDSASAGNPRIKASPKMQSNSISNEADERLKRLHEVATLVDREGFSDAVCERILREVLRVVHSELGIFLCSLNLAGRFQVGCEIGLNAKVTQELAAMAVDGFSKAGAGGRLISARDSDFPNLTKLMRGEGFNGCYLLPIFGRKNVFAGTFCCFYEQRKILSEAEILESEMYGRLASGVIETKAAEIFTADEEKRRLNEIPVPAYACNVDGLITAYNDAAVELWGRTPELGKEYWCGSWKTYFPDGKPLPLEECPIAIAIREGRSVRGFEIMIERPDGTRAEVLPYPEPIRDAHGRVSGAVNMLLDISEFSEARRASQQLAAIVQGSEDAIISKDLTSIIKTWNQGAQTLFGYTAAEMVGKPVTLLMPEHCYDEEPEILSKIRSGRRIEHYETIRKRKDGTLVNVSLSVSPIYDATGRIVGASKIARDITEQKRAAETLTQRTHTLEVINRTGARLAAELDLSKLLQLVTDVATELSGAQFGALLYNSVSDSGESDLLYTLSGAHRESFDKLRSPKQTPLFAPTFRGQKVVRFADVTQSAEYGQNLPFQEMGKGELPVRSYLAVPVISRTGKVLGGLFFGHEKSDVFTEESEQIVSGIAGQAAVAMDNAKLYSELRRELSEHKRAEAALRQSESQFRLLAELLPQMVWTARPDGYIDYYNQRWLDFTGAKEAYGDESWSEILHPEDLQRTVDAWHESVGSGTPFQIEFRYKDQHEGGYRWFLGRAYPVRNDAGEIVKWLGTSTDIDEQKRAEEKLEQTVKERTSKLRDTVAELEAFSYSIAHDMRAPLRAMSGFSSLLQEDYSEGLPEEAKTYLVRIARSAQRMDQLIQDVLNYSRISRGEMPLEKTNVEQLLREILESYPHLREGMLEVDIQSSMPEVVANSAALTQCISNILSNAVKFVAPDTKPRVQIRAEERGEFVRLWFEDNGIGISREGQKRIFNMFQRLHGVEDFEGTGIGLTIVRKAVERMGGSAGVESREGQGSRFWLELRRAD